jgi:maltooligosyltrehalose trehalohydrolase
VGQPARRSSTSPTTRTRAGPSRGQGRRSEFAAFGWKADEVPDPQDAATFERSKLDWNELERPEHADLLAWHRD